MSVVEPLPPSFLIEELRALERATGEGGGDRDDRMACVAGDAAEYIARAERALGALPLVYLAGPYSKPDPIVNVHECVKLANRLLDCCIPVLPHTAMVWHLVSPKPYEEWLRMDSAVQRRCDALLRWGGESSGADGELRQALEWGQPVFGSPEDLRRWVAADERWEFPWFIPLGVDDEKCPSCNSEQVTCRDPERCPTILAQEGK